MEIFNGKCDCRHELNLSRNISLIFIEKKITIIQELKVTKKRKIGILGVRFVTDGDRSIEEELTH